MRRILVNELLLRSHQFSVSRKRCCLNQTHSRLSLEGRLRLG